MQKERRQFSIDIIRCDGFVSMPAPAQALYLQLVMSADDEGFTSQMEMCKFLAHANDEDEKMLIDREFIYQFQGANRKVTVIKHWRKNNWIRNEKVVKSEFSERSLVYVKPNGNYTLEQSEGAPLDNKGAAKGLSTDCLATAERLPSDCQRSADPMQNDKEEKNQKKETTQLNLTQSNLTQSKAKQGGAGRLTSQTASTHTKGDDDELF